MEPLLEVGHIHITKVTQHNRNNTHNRLGNIHNMLLVRLLGLLHQ